MKVGQHAGENFEDILQRKKEEYEAAGMIFWGYGGTTLHPTKTVQPFMRTYEKKNGIFLMMQIVKSNADPDIIPAKEYSSNGVDWEPIPDGINVYGSRYALVLDNIEPGELDLKISHYKVGYGLSEGKLAHEYLKGRVDKGCFSKAEKPLYEPDAKDVKKISYQAKIKNPYAVFLR